MRQNLPPSANGQRRRSQVRVVLAWSVHLYTALGLACAAGMAVLIFQGDEASFRGAFWLMFLATLIDATDGTLARKVHIKEVLPGFDGRRLDDLVDFLTYVALPLLLIWRAGLLPAGYEACLLVPLMASAYGFCQVSAKTDDGYFLGFPSYWNLVAFYLYVLRLPAWVGLAIVLGLALLTFVPSRYLYPTQRGRLNLLANILGAVWGLMLAGTLWALGHPGGEEQAWQLGVASLYFPVFYFAASWVVTLRWWRRRRRGKRGPDRGDVVAVSTSAPS
jgi:phosphatidylcholine synthase